MLPYKCPFRKKNSFLCPYCCTISLCVCVWCVCNACLSVYVLIQDEVLTAACAAAWVRCEVSHGLSHGDITLNGVLTSQSHTQSHTLLSVHWLVSDLLARKELICPRLHSPLRVGAQSLSNYITWHVTC